MRAIRPSEARPARFFLLAIVLAAAVLGASAGTAILATRPVDQTDAAPVATDAAQRVVGSGPEGPAHTTYFNSEPTDEESTRTDSGDVGQESRPPHPSEALEQIIRGERSGDNAPARLANAVASGKITESESALEIGRLLTGRGPLTEEARYRSGDSPYSGTRLIYRMQDLWPRIESPTRDELRAFGFEGADSGPVALPLNSNPADDCITSSANFDIHWDVDTLGYAGSCATIPNYVTKTITYFEDTLTKQVTNRGWTKPPSDSFCTSDGGSGRYDIFLTGHPPLPPGAWGFTATNCLAQRLTPAQGDNENSVAVETTAMSSYISLVTNPTALNLTIDNYLDQLSTHEFNHSIQFGYTLTGGEWLGESTAQWMMTEVNPTTLNWGFNQDYLRFTDVSLTAGIGPPSDLHPYGAWLFNEYYSEHHGGQSKVRAFWEEAIAEPDPAKAVDKAIAANGTNFATVFRNHAIANAVMSNNPVNSPYTYSKSGTWLSPHREVNLEGSIPFNGTPPVPYDSSVPGNGNQRLQSRGIDYVRIDNPTGLPFRVCAAKNPGSSGVIGAALVKQRTNGVASVQNSTGNPPCTQIDDAPGWDTFTLVILNLEQGGQTNLFYTVSVALPVYNGPSTEWYFAEGYTGPGFEEWLVIQNPSNTNAAVRIDYQLNGGGVVNQNLFIAPKARASIRVNDVVGGGKEVSARIRTTNSVPIVAERSMYFDYQSAFGVYRGGHVAIGTQTPRTDWYLAEGYTGSGFDEYITLQNATTETANVTITYQFNPSGTQVQNFQVPANSRFTVGVHDAVGRGREVSARVQTSVPMVVERPMYFNYNGIYDGGHVTIAAPAPATVWNFAEGYTAPGFDEYITLQNPSTTQNALVDITYQFADATTLNRPQISIPPSARFTVSVHDDVQRRGDVSAKVVSNIPIVAERPMYFEYGPLGATGGHDVLGATGTSRAFYFAEGSGVAGFHEYLTIQNANAFGGRATVLYMRSDGAVTSQRINLPPNSRTTISAHNAMPGVEFGVAVFANLQIAVERPTYFNIGGRSDGSTVVGAGA